MAARGRPAGGGNHAAVEAERLRIDFLEAVKKGASIAEARAATGVSVSQYEKWRARHPGFRETIDSERLAASEGRLDPEDLDDAGFALRYFGIDYAPFQLDFINRMRNLRLGDILMALWPPEHGKTTVFENYANHVLAVNPEHRFTIASEASRISRKISGRIRNRMGSDGSAKDYVRDWGPFEPQFGVGRRSSQPWTDSYFNVYKKRSHDERDNSVQAVGRDSSIVSTRTDQLHIDDLQSLKTIRLTTKLEDYVRQDLLSRPGEHGKTTWAGTRVDDDDVYSRFMDDEELTGILHVVKYPAIVTNAITGELEPLLPQRYTLENLDRIRRKSRDGAWNRGYMQDPAAASDERPIDDDAIERAKDFNLLLNHSIEDNAQCIITLDPALGGYNCTMGWEVRPDRKLVLRRIMEKRGLRSNEQIMDELGRMVMNLRASGGRVTDVIIETMNFQKGLARDERLREMKEQYGFALRDHLTGWNKYDQTIGIASMATDIRAGDLIIPYGQDTVTRLEVDEVIRQWKKWKNGMNLRGNKIRVDRLMCTWFAWIWWQNRYKRVDEKPAEDAGGWKRQGLPFKRTDVGLIVPMNYKVSA